MTQAAGRVKGRVKGNLHPQRGRILSRGLCARGQAYSVKIPSGLRCEETVGVENVSISRQTVNKSLGRP